MSRSLEKQIRIYNVKRFIDILLPAIFLFFAVIWMVQSVIAIVSAWTPFVAVRLWIVGFPMHGATALNLTLLYVVNYLFYRTFLSGHDRVVRALLFTLMGVFFYDFVWSLCCITINGYGSFILPLASTFIVAIFMLSMHRQTKILQWNWKLIFPIVSIYVITLIEFISSGFFQQMALFDLGMGSDPNTWVWLFNKTAALWMWMAVALR